MGKLRTIRRHEVLALHRPQRDDLLVRPLVAHDADGLHGQEHREGLRDLVVEVRLADLFDVDDVGVLEDGDLGAGDGAEDADRETWSGEGVALDEWSGNAEETTEGADFVCKYM